MAFTGKEDSNVAVDGGGNQDTVDRGTFKFDGTALEVELPTRLSKIRPGGVDLVPMPGTTDPEFIESVYLKEAAVSGVVSVPTSGEITVARKVEVGGTATTDLEVFYCLRGASKDY